MFALIATGIFIIIIVLNILIIIGLPLGELTLGGKYKILPPKLRILAFFSLVMQVFCIVIILQAANYISLWFSIEVTKNICFALSIYFLLNTVMNLLSKSKNEKYIMTPLSLMVAICFFVTAFSMCKTI